MIFTILCQVVPRRCGIPQLVKSKTILVMKLTAVFCWRASYRSLRRGFPKPLLFQKKTFHCRSFSGEIKKQTGYVFFYNMRLLQKTHPVSIDVKNKGLKEVLDQIFAAQPVSYSIVNKTVVVNERAAYTAAGCDAKRFNACYGGDSW